MKAVFRVEWWDYPGIWVNTNFAVDSPYRPHQTPVGDNFCNFQGETQRGGLIQIVSLVF